MNLFMILMILLSLHIFLFNPLTGSTMSQSQKIETSIEINDRITESKEEEEEKQGPLIMHHTRACESAKIPKVRFQNFIGGPGGPPIPLTPKTLLETHSELRTTLYISRATSGFANLYQLNLKNQK